MISSVNLPLAAHGTSPVRMFFRPHQRPRSILSRIFTRGFIRSVVIKDAIGQIVGVTDVKPSGWVLENVREEHSFWLQR